MFEYCDLINTWVAVVIKYQPHGGSHPLLSIKTIKIEKERGACYSKLF